MRIQPAPLADSVPMTSMRHRTAIRCLFIVCVIINYASCGVASQGGHPDAAKVIKNLSTGKGGETEPVMHYFWVES